MDELLRGREAEDFIREHCRHYAAPDLRCRCGCGLLVFAPAFVLKLERMADAAGYAPIMTSGCRCDAHNAAVGGSPGSSHRIGRAADLSAPVSRDRHTVLVAAVGQFDRVGIGADFIHVDDDPAKTPRLVWLY